jgi:hypothetical protein
LGNGETIARAQLAALAEYLDALVDAVEAGFEAGQSLSQVRASAILDRYRGTPHYPGRAQQIADVYRTLRRMRVDVSAFALTRYEFQNAEFCASYDPCLAGGALPAGAVAVNLTIGRRLGVGGELTVNGQSWISRGSRFYDEELAVRETSTALLFRFDVARAGTLGVVLVGGAAWEANDALGMNRDKEAVAPFGGRHAIAANGVSSGFIVGVDLTRSIGDRVGMVVPIRMTHTDGVQTDKWPSGFELRAGIGLRTTVFRRRH